MVLDNDLLSYVYIILLIVYLVKYFYKKIQVKQNGEDPIGEDPIG